MKLLRLSLSLLALASGALAGCGNPFDPQNLVESVRLLAISADKPYAAPGDTVNMTALAYDGRPPVTPPPPPMTVYWVPIACVDPPGDSYFACYPAFAEAGLTQGVDLTSKLTAGEVGNVAAFLSSPLASGITGTTVYVDKGYHAMGMAVPAGGAE